MRFLLPFLLLLSTASLAQHHRPRHTAAPAVSKELAYYCASGNTVKYPASPTCRGLNRCSATVKPMALSEAQASMDPCKVCH